MAARIVEFQPTLESNFSVIECILEAKTTVGNNLVLYFYWRLQNIRRFWSDMLCLFLRSKNLLNLIYLIIFPLPSCRKRAQNMPAYYTIQSRFDQFFAEGGRSKNKIQWNNKALIQCFGR